MTRWLRTALGQDYKTHLDNKLKEIGPVRSEEEKGTIPIRVVIYSDYVKANKYDRKEYIEPQIDRALTKDPIIDKVYPLSTDDTQALEDVQNIMKSLKFYEDKFCKVILYFHDETVEFYTYFNKDDSVAICNTASEVAGKILEHKHTRH